MKRLRLGVLLILAAVGVAAIGSAALSSISFGRDINAGKILVDTDQNVAIQITNKSNYTGLVKTEPDGKVSLNLSAAINNNTNSGFNTDAVFSIGSAANGVIRIKNNSDIPVTVTMANGEGNGNAITMAPSNGSGATISVGASSDFYFTIDTNGHDALKTLSAVLRIQGQ